MCTFSSSSTYFKRLCFMSSLKSSRSFWTCFPCKSPPWYLATSQHLNYLTNPANIAYQTTRNNYNLVWIPINKLGWIPSMVWNPTIAMDLYSYFCYWFEFQPLIWVEIQLWFEFQPRLDQIMVGIPTIPRFTTKDHGWLEFQPYPYFQPKC